MRYSVLFIQLFIFKLTLKVGKSMTKYPVNINISLVTNTKPIEKQISKVPIR